MIEFKKIFIRCISVLLSIFYICGLFLMRPMRCPMVGRHRVDTDKFLLSFTTKMEVALRELLQKTLLIAFWERLTDLRSCKRRDYWLVLIMYRIDSVPKRSCTESTLFRNGHVPNWLYRNGYVPNDLEAAHAQIHGADDATFRSFVGKFVNISALSDEILFTYRLYIVFPVISPLETSATINRTSVNAM